MLLFQGSHAPGFNGILIYAWNIHFGMNEWHLHQHRKNLRFRKPLLLTGLPGIGNVGKVVVDFLVEELDAQIVYSFTSHSFPHCVFVNDQNLVELPRISLYHIALKQRDLLLLAGDVQPIDERSCYQFCENLLSLLVKSKGIEIVTLGGIGLSEVPKKPRLYCTGNDQAHIKAFASGTEMSQELYGVIGPIIGVSGLLLGLSEHYRIPSVGILAETYGHPMYLGVGGARMILKILKKKLDLDISPEELEKEIRQVEMEVQKRSKDLGLAISGKARKSDMDYIG